MIDSREVARAHDAMAGEYDAIDDPWYTHLFSVLHEILLDSVAEKRKTVMVGGRALDIGCGTGLQSYLLADAGFDVDAFDLSTGLLEVARRKATSPPTWSSGTAFDKSMCAAHARAKSLNPSAKAGVIKFFEGDAQDTQCYGGGPYDIVACYGSVISFVSNPSQVLRLMRGACKSDGVIIIEAEMKINLDLLWQLVDSLVGNRIGYGLSIKDAFRDICRAFDGDIITDYPFALEDETELHLPLRLFSFGGLCGRIRDAGLRVVNAQSVHSVSNVFPSIFLHKKLGWFLGLVFSQLAKLDRKVGKHWPCRQLGCSLALRLQPCS